MKKRLYLISPKLKMALSAILLVCSLYFLWSSLQFAMPTRLLSIKKVEAEQCLAPGKWTLYRPSFNPKSNTGGWYFSRRGDKFFIAMPFQNNGPLWDSALGPYLTAPLSPYILDFNLVTDIKDGITFTAFIEDMILVTTPDPHVARVELVLGVQTAECTESSPGSGFWVGTLRITNEENISDIRAHAYDASGNLIGITEP